MTNFAYGGREIMNRKEGFTLIEILLVVVIIGIMLAVIVPRAWRANVDTKYGLIRQNGAELGSFAMQWVEDCIQSQDPQDSTAVTASYYASLSGSSTGVPMETQMWVANPTANPWVSSPPPVVTGRLMPGSTIDTAPQNPVKSLVPPEKSMVNPFNGLNVFAPGNFPALPVTGALASCMGARETDGWYYVALLFQGTDSNVADFSDGTFFAGQDITSQGLRNGIFVARIQSL